MTEFEEDEMIKLANHADNLRNSLEGMLKVYREGRVSAANFTLVSSAMGMAEQALENYNKFKIS